MAVFRPDPASLEAQFASLAAQTRRPDLVVAVIADRSSADIVTGMGRNLDLRIETVTPDDMLDSVNAFQLGLQVALLLTPPATAYALCDQDDVWHADRLSAGIAALSDGADLAHSDARIVDADGKVLHGSMFRMERRLRKPGLRGLLYRNTVTGMTLTIRRAAVELALPFPRQSGVHFYHDLWLALVAEARGGIAFIDRPLVDYRQHATNTIGVVDRRGRRFRLWPQLPLRLWFRREAAGYGLARYLAQCLHTRMSTAAVTDAAVRHDRLDYLRRYMRRLRGAGGHAADCVRYVLTGHPDLGRIAFGQSMVMTGRMFWTLRHVLAAGVSAGSTAFDERLYSLSPGLPPPQPEAKAGPGASAGALSDMTDRRKHLRFEPVFTAEAPAVTVLVPTLNPTEIFAGIATAVDLGLALAAAGHNVRFIATDLPLAAPAVSHQFLIARLSAAQADSGAAGRISLHCGISEPQIPAHSEDVFLATAWWTALVADALIARYGFVRPKFLYLIQDYEPGFYPWGPEFADAEASYRLDFVPVFNTTLLRDHFAALGHDFADPDALTFRPSIDVARYAAVPRTPRAAETPRRIALYGRPEVARNLFVTALEALDLFLQAEGLTPRDVIIESVGLRHAPVRLSGGHRVQSLGKLPLAEYPRYLARADLGLSLMLSPHPSHPPLEMAAAGARVVTNVFGGKDLSRLGPAILSAEPEARDLAAALSSAWHLPPVTEDERRLDLSPLGAPLEETALQLDALLRASAPKKPRRRLIVHVGAPKCGSTYLQRVLLQNRAALAAQSIAYPHDGGEHPGNGGTLSDLDAERLQADFGDCRTLIYSHEDLIVSPERVGGLAAAAAALEVDVEFVAFLKPFSGILYGTFSQFMKQHFERWLETRKPYDGLSFEDFIRLIAPRYPMDMFLDRWQRRFADSRFTVASSDNIRATFEMLLPGTTLNWDVPKAQANPSLRIEDCEEIAALITDGAMSDDSIRAIWREAHARAGQPDAGRSPERTALIESLFETNNATILEKFGFDNRLPEPPARGPNPVDSAA